MTQSRENVIGIQCLMKIEIDKIKLNVCLIIAKNYSEMKKISNNTYDRNTHQKIDLNVTNAVV